MSRLTLPGVLALTLLLTEPLCGMAFRCGCQAPWAGGASHCNVTRAGEPHCPWCEVPALGAVGGGLVMLLQSAAYLSLRRRGRRAAVAALVAVLLLPPAFAASAGLTWLATDYPHFLGMDARTRVGVPPGPVHCGG